MNRNINRPPTCSISVIFCQQILFLALLSYFSPFTIAAFSSPCYPNDPDGANSGNLCLTFPTSLVNPSDDVPVWSPLPNRPTNKPPFIQGIGKEAYYGYPVSTTQPGRVVGTTTGFWTNVEAIDGTTSIKDSKGNTISVP